MITDLGRILRSPLLGESLVLINEVGERDINGEWAVEREYTTETIGTSYPDTDGEERLLGDGEGFRVETRRVFFVPANLTVIPLGEFSTGSIIVWRDLRYRCIEVERRKSHIKVLGLTAQARDAVPGVLQRPGR